MAARAGLALLCSCPALAAADPPTARNADVDGLSGDRMLANIAVRRVVLHADRADPAGPAVWRWILERDTLPAQAPPPPAGLHAHGIATPRVSIGVLMATGPRMELGWQSPALGGEIGPRAPAGLVLRPSDPLADLRMGALMRMSLGGASVSLRPRKGGLKLTLQSQW